MRRGFRGLPGFRPLGALVMSLALVLLAQPAAAQTIKVQSGEHAGFSRLVLVLPRGTEWDLRRLPEGYRLGFAGQRLVFDVSTVFRLIPRDRLASIRAETDGTGLLLGIACACHAVAFEDRPGVLVVDLRDGPPPAGLTSERGADGTPLPPLAGRSAMPRPPQRPDPALPPQPPDPALARRDAANPPAPQAYDWRSLAVVPTGPDRTRPAAPALDRLTRSAGSPDEGLRRQIVEDMARGAARGVIDMAVPPAAGSDRLAGSAQSGGGLAEAGLAGGGTPQVRVGDGTQIATLTEPRGPGGLSATGAACMADSGLAIQDWGEAEPPAQALGRRTMAVLGEFDRPDPEAVLGAVRYLLHLGFGAEALAMIALAEGRVPQEPYATMARILDGEPAPGAAFGGMEVCPTAAALWSVLALPDLGGRPGIDTAAVLRAFSALPVHLRRHLGPALTERFLARGDTATARGLADAILRAPGDPGDAVRLLETELERSSGRVPDPGALADLRAASGETGIRATVAHLRAEAEAGRIPADSVLVAAEALLPTVEGTPLGDDLRAALAPALAMNGQIERALALAGDGPAAGPVWAAIAATAPDGAFLAQAVRASGLPVPPLPAGPRHAVAERLIALGFPQEARRWLDPGALPPGPQGTAEALTRARAELAAADARAALATLARQEGEAAARLRAEALARLGDPGAAEALRAAGEPAAAAAEDRRQRDWGRLADTDDAWGGGARAVLVGPAPGGEIASLAGAAAVLAEAAAAREAARALLAATPRP